MKSRILNIFIIFSLSFCILSTNFFVGNFYNIVYAADDWEESSIADQVNAFKAYCKSRNVAIDGSILDAVTSWTTSTYNDICNSLGIDPAQLQAEIKHRTDSNKGLQWLFTQQGLSAYNRIFAEFLQNNDLNVGDEVENKQVYSGKYFTDADGNGCFIWVMPSRINVDSNNVYPIVYGDTYKYTGLDIADLYDSGVNEVTLNLLDNQLYTFPISFYESSRDHFTNLYYIDNYTIGTQGWYFHICKATRGGITIHNRLIIYTVSDTNYLYLGSLTEKQGAPYLIDYGWINLTTIDSDSDNTENADIYITTNNKIINNETTINEGDTYIINNYGEPDSGDNDDGNPDDEYPVPDIKEPISEPGNYNPGGTTEIGSDGTIDFPDFDINLPSINWSLDGITKKFPFCIPFDIVNLFKAFDAEPIAPKIQGSIPFGNWYIWDIDIDFASYDNYAAIVRIVELIGFVFGLISITIRLVKG